MVSHKIAHYRIGVCTRGGHGSGMPESTPARFLVFLSDPGLESNICEKTNPESHFNFGRSLRAHFLRKNMRKLRLDR